MNNNEAVIIKGKVDAKLNEAFKKVLLKKNITQQDFVEKKVKEFVLENIDILFEKENKGNAIEK